jgi:hypothetical protein
MRFAFGLACIFFAGVGLASNKGLRLDVTKPDLFKQIELISSAVKDSKEFSEISEGDKNIVLETLMQVKSEVSVAAKFDPANLTDEQEKVNAILDRAEADSRLICVREKPLGSHMPIKICTTVAARKRNAEKADNSLRANQENKIDQGAGSLRQ